MLAETTLAKYVPASTSTSNVIDVPARMILEIAAGVEEPARIAERYGYFQAQWEALMKFQPFIDAVEAKKQELLSSGYTFKTRAAMMANDLREEVYRDAKKEDANAHTRLETVKFLSRAAGVDSPVKEAGPVGNGVSITINIPSMNGVGPQQIEIHAGNTFDMEAKPDYLKTDETGSLTFELEPDSVEEQE